MKTGYEPELTRRERDIISLLCLGMSTSEIAGELCVTHRTVRTHIEHIFDKLHVRNRVQIVVYAYNNRKVLQAMNETVTALANLDWLIYHENARLDFKAGVVYDENGEPEYLVSDLATIGLTPATEVSV